jgi:esterase/lipase superfamily enzyme
LSLKRLLVFILSVASLQCYAKAALYTLDEGLKHPYAVKEIGKIFDQIFEKEDTKNIVIYVHGLGKNPKKSLNDGALPNVAELSDVHAILFSWPSWKGLFNRPLDNAVNSAWDLADLLYTFDLYRFKNKHKFKDRKVTLLLHSMGNILFRVFLESIHHARSFDAQLFDVVILNAPDVPYNGHAQWLNKLDFTNQIYVTQHSNDIILYISKKIFYEKPIWRGPKLGASFDYSGAPLQLAKNTTYLDLTELTFFGHRHFNMPPPFKNKKVTALFKKLLNAQDISEVDKNIGLYKILNNQKIYLFSTDSM